MAVNSDYSNETLVTEYLHCSLQTDKFQSWHKTKSRKYQKHTQPPEYL